MAQLHKALCTFCPLSLKGRGYFTNEKDGGAVPLWPLRLSRLVVIWEEADFFRVLIICKQINVLYISQGY